MEPRQQPCGSTTYSSTAIPTAVIAPLAALGQTAKTYLFRTPTWHNRSSTAILIVVHAVVFVAAREYLRAQIAHYASNAETLGLEAERTIALTGIWTSTAAPTAALTLLLTYDCIVPVLIPVVFISCFRS